MARRYAERDADIMRRRRAGETLKEIGARHGICGQRVSQIIRKETNEANRPDDELKLSGRAERWIKLKLDFHGLGIEEGITVDDLVEFERRGHLSFKDSGYNVGKKTIKEIAAALALARGEG